MNVAAGVVNTSSDVQQLQARLNPDASQQAGLDLMPKGMETLLARMG